LDAPGLRITGVCPFKGPAKQEKGLLLTGVLASADRERAWVNFQKIIRAESLGLSEYIAQKKDGTKFPVMVHTSRIVKEGKTVGFRGFLIDISGKKAMEDQLLRAQKLEGLGYKVLTAGGGRQGVVVFERKKPFTMTELSRNIREMIEKR